MTTITVLGDGAEWIWNAATRQFGGCHQLLDIYHAAEHIAAAAKHRFGEGTAATDWLDRGRGLLLSDGWAGLCDHLGQTLETEDRPDGRAALDELTSYFAAHTERLNYCHRLYTGRSIGSGMVEGAAKNLIGKRLKQTGARWDVDNVNDMAQLCCLTYSDHWDLYCRAPLPDRQNPLASTLAEGFGLAARSWASFAGLANDHAQHARRIGS